MREKARQDWLLRAVLAVGLTGAGLRCLAVPRLLGDVDAVNLARGLAHFDVFAQAPHAPGYPVLIAAAKLFGALGVENDIWALALPGILLWPPAAAALYAGLRPWVASGPAFAVVVFASLAPGVVVTSGWPGSDGLGLSLLALAIGATRLSGRHAWIVCGALLGLLLGTRLSWWPIVAGSGVYVLWHERRYAIWLSAGGAAGVLTWLVPMLVLFEPRRLLHLALGFGVGHVTEWGGTAFSTGAASTSRLAALAWGFWDAGLGAAWPFSAPGTPARGESGIAGFVLVLLIVAGGVGLARSRPRPTWLAPALLLAVPYVAWLLGFQNLEKTRHLLPLVPLAALFVGAGLSSLRHHGLWLAAATIALFAVTLPRANEQGRVPVPAVAFASWLVETHAPDGLVVFAGQEARVLERYAPMYRVVRPATDRVLVTEAERASRLGVRVLVTTATPGFERLAPRLTAVRVFRFAHSVRPHESNLGIFELPPTRASTVATSVAPTSLVGLAQNGERAALGGLP